MAKTKRGPCELNITPGARVADIGAGGGYFTWPLAEAVRPQGTVYAEEINDTALGIIQKEMQARRITNVIPVRAVPDGAKLPRDVELVYTCDTYHHMKNRVAYFQSMLGYLKPDGKVAIGFLSPWFPLRAAWQWDSQRTCPPGDGICRLSVGGRS